MIREFILQMKLGRVHREYFERKFGVDVRQKFAGPLAELEGTGFVRLEGDALRLSREGLLQVDKLLHQFFLPQHRDAR
jgi:oxygen-independent coproporphyrinogen-3 oxidase